MLASEQYVMSSRVRSCEGAAVAFLGSFVKLRKVAIRFVMSVRLSAWNNSDPTERIFMKLDVGVCFRKTARIFKIH